MLNTGSIFCNKIEKHVPLKYLAVGPWQRRHDPWGPQESPSLPAANGTVRNNIVQLWSMPECSLLPLSPEPSNKTPLSPWFTIFSVTDPPPSTPPLGLVLHQASASLKSRLELTFKNPTTPGTFLRMRHWASQSSKSQDVGCWRALRTSLSFYYETQSKHSKHFLAVSGPPLHEWAKVFRGNVRGAQNISWRNYFQLFDTGTTAIRLRMLQPESYRIYRVFFLTGPP